MQQQYVILSQTTLDSLPLPISPEPAAGAAPATPQLLLEMTFSPKLFVSNDLLSQLQPLCGDTTEWLPAAIDASPSQPQADEIRHYDYYHMAYIQQSYRLTELQPQPGRLNWLDAATTRFDFSRLADIPLAERRLFKLAEDYGLVFIHLSLIELLQQQANTIWVRRL